MRLGTILSKQKQKQMIDRNKTNQNSKFKCISHDMSTTKMKTSSQTYRWSNRSYNHGDFEPNIQNTHEISTRKLVIGLHSPLDRRS